MRDDPEKMISRYLAGDASDGEVHRLLEWAAESDGNAEAFGRACLLDQLTSELYREGRIDVTGNTFSPPLPFSRRRRKMTLALVAGTVATLFCLAAWWTSKGDSRGFATITQSVGARRESGRTVQTGLPVDRQRYSLSEGLIRIDFENGASMSVEGPARFEVRDAMNVFFESGVSSFHIPETATGFTVDTADTEVVDLGTAFGLVTGREGETNVAVFEGEVEVEGQLVREGEAVGAGESAFPEPRIYDTSRFERTWPVTSGVLQTTGMMKFVSPGPGFVPGRFEDDDHIMVFLERREVRIDDPVDIDLADPGEYRRLHRRQDGPEIAAGTRVRSYLLQLDPVGLLDKWDGDKPRVEGQITFDRPILGLIANGRKLLETDAILGHSEGDYGNLPRGLEPPKKAIETAELEGKDVLVLAADQRTLILNIAAGSAVDQIRVLVEVE